MKSIKNWKGTLIMYMKMNKILQFFIYFTVCILVMVNPNNVFGESQIMLQEKIKIILETYQPEMNESHKRVMVKKSEIEKLLSQIRYKKYQGQTNICSEADLEKLNKIHQYYMGVFALEFTAKALRHFLDRFCYLGPSDIWCKSAQQHLDSPSEFEVPTFNPQIKPRSESMTTRFPANRPTNPHIPKTQPKFTNATPPQTNLHTGRSQMQLKPLPSWKNNLPEKTKISMNKPQSTHAFISDTGQKQSLSNKVESFKQLVIDTMHGAHVDQQRMNESFPGYSFSKDFDINTDITSLVKRINEEINKHHIYNLNYDLYYMFGQYRKAANRYDDYLENICLAYIYADICGKIKILKELDVLNQLSRQKTFMVSETSYDTLKVAGLLQNWNENKLLVGVNVCFCP